MNEIELAAEKALVALSVQLSMQVVSCQLELELIRLLRDVLPDCKNIQLSLESIRWRASELINAQKGRDLGRAKTALRYATEQYFREAAAARYDDWRDKAQSRVIEP
ncbi:hypothetical protein [uncultured Tateyamaria sp.]|uniref:hypothetical protein n=1 Tax=Tateyamaria sp. 1078 TaxID=3417464 RepID=UPI0026071366|nr:hypothetical protein [uncultured Tateyamaria sp.]